MRVIRVLKLLKHIPITLDFIRAIKNYKAQFKVAVVLFSSVIFIVSVLVYHVEG